MPCRWKTSHGFTLLEVMISASVAGVLLSSIVLGGVAFQRLFAAADENYKASSAQSRVLDYIARDVGRALSGTVANGGQRIDIKLPDYIDSSITPPAEQRRTPTIVSGTLTYGNPADSITASYYMINQSIVRDQTTVRSGVTTTARTIVSSDDESFQLSFADPANPGSTASFSFTPGGTISSVKTTITFMPKFNRLNLASSRDGTSISATTILRYAK